MKGGIYMRKILSRCALGMVIGVFVNYLVAVSISLIVGDGYFYPCAEDFASQFNTEIAAVAVQFILAAIMGAGIGAGTLVWETERSIVWQTAVYFIIISLTMLPIAYACHWMQHSVSGVLGYIGIFLIVFIFWWAVQYTIYKIKLKKINSNLM